MAWYNPLTDQIIDAKPGSLSYLHEQGHQYLQRRFRFYFWKVPIDRFILVVTLWALAQGGPLDLLIARYIIVGKLAFDFCDEGFAWAYAFTHRARAGRL